MIVSRQDGKVIDIDVKLHEERDYWAMLSSDWHWDNPKCDRDLLKRHLEFIKGKNGHILIFGDLFCAMEGRGDPRRSRDIRPEHNNAKYLDSLVDNFCEWIEPYKLNLAVITYGNHETGVLKNCETDLLKRVSDKLGVNIGRYSGYIRFKVFSFTKSTATTNINLFYHHGSHAGDVTKGIIGANRRSAYVGNVDIIVSGHNHEGWILETPIDTINFQGFHTIKSLWHINTPSYKQEYTHDGFHVQRGRPPKPLGCWYFNLGFDWREKSRCKYQFIRGS